MNQVTQSVQRLDPDWMTGELEDQDLIPSRERDFSLHVKTGSGGGGH